MKETYIRVRLTNKQKEKLRKMVCDNNTTITNFVITKLGLDCDNKSLMLSTKCDNKSVSDIRKRDNKSVCDNKPIKQKSTPAREEKLSLEEFVKRNPRIPSYLRETAYQKQI